MTREYETIAALWQSFHELMRGHHDRDVEGDAAASRIGYVTMGMSVIPMMAPILGGLLDEAFGWRANFAMLLAAGAAALALAWVAEGIRVNAVAPGYIETAINAAGRQDEAHYRRIAERTAFGRWGQPEDVAGAVVFLCTDAARYATGTVVAVDGGFLAG